MTKAMSRSCSFSHVTLAKAFCCVFPAGGLTFGADRAQNAGEAKPGPMQALSSAQPNHVQGSTASNSAPARTPTAHGFTTRRKEGVSSK